MHTGISQGRRNLSDFSDHGRYRKIRKAFAVKKALLIIGILSLLAAIGVAAVIIYMGLSTRTNSHSQRYSNSDWLIAQFGDPSFGETFDAHPGSMLGDAETGAGLAGGPEIEPLFSRPAPQASLKTLLRRDALPGAAGRKQHPSAPVSGHKKHASSSADKSASHPTAPFNPEAFPKSRFSGTDHLPAAGAPAFEAPPIADGFLSPAGAENVSPPTQEAAGNTRPFTVPDGRFPSIAMPDEPTESPTPPGEIPGMPPILVTSLLPPDFAPLGGHIELPHPSDAPAAAPRLKQRFERKSPQIPRPAGKQPPATVPEPDMAFLLGTGLLVLAALKKTLSTGPDDRRPNNDFMPQVPAADRPR